MAAHLSVTDVMLQGAKVLASLGNLTLRLPARCVLTAISSVSNRKLRTC